MLTTLYLHMAWSQKRIHSTSPAPWTIGFKRVHKQVTYWSRIKSENNSGIKIYNWKLEFVIKVCRYISKANMFSFWLSYCVNAILYLISNLKNRNNNFYKIVTITDKVVHMLLVKKHIIIVLVHQVFNIPWTHSRAVKERKGGGSCWGDEKHQSR